MDELLRKKRDLAVYNVNESFVKEGKNPRLLLAYWPDVPFDEAFEAMSRDPQLSEEDRQALQSAWGTLAQIVERADEEPLFGIVIVFFEGQSAPGIVPIPAAAEDLIQLP
ncbi:hypothetical protein [Oceanithermus sp.]|uniref:hypothetical protein n=1 Tax=Oceanithermus sp. TaxID=2268145 RepID=UPI0025806827|nr:hypothetical protein [Oceanithermus sp.]